jgi:hypothetical protein
LSEVSGEEAYRVAHSFAIRHSGEIFKHRLSSFSEFCGKVVVKFPHLTRLAVTLSRILQAFNIFKIVITFDLFLFWIQLPEI